MDTKTAENVSAPAAAAGNKKYTLPPEQIVQWKKAHGDIFVYEADGLVAYLKRPSRTVIDLAATRGQGSNFNFAEIILTNCWLGGDEALRREDKYFMGLAQKVGELVEIKTGELKKV